MMRRFGRGSFLSSIVFFLSKKFFSGPISILVRTVSTAIVAHRSVAISTSIPDCNIHKIADLKLGALQRDIFVARFSSRDSFSDFFHSIAVHSRVLINDCEMEFRSFLARFWIDSSDEIRDLLQRCVHPGVNLQFIVWRLITRKVVWSVVPSFRMEDSEQHWAGLFSVHRITF